ncbi:calcium-binding protein [Roseomonas sp. BU-1]|uniref:Calcium-binding protein n=2 Tax=Falsiroseomonas selenitidurans TaxID=2716335 RepID=A0ABX1DZJ9_9PROT|nr:calcium-binding protein [Falsiroseomonas selenitidurans]
MQGMDLNQLNLSAQTLREVNGLQEALDRFFASSNHQDLLQDPDWRHHISTLQQQLIDRIGQVGGEGQDQLSGADNTNDTLRGNAGDDTLLGGDGRDRIGGGAGADLLYGDWAEDRPGGGADTMDGGIGDGAADIAHGGGGDDTYIWRTGDGNDRFHGGAGSDTLVIGGVGPNQLFENFWLQEGVWMTSTDDRTFFFVNAQGERVQEVSGTLRFGDEVLTFSGVSTIRLP